MKQEWRTITSFLKDSQCHSINPLLRLLLSSDGTIVRNFNALFLAPTEIEVVDQHEIVVDDGMSRQLSVPKGEKAIERSVWLKNVGCASSKQRLLHAISILPILNFSPDLYQALQLGQKPLGQIIEENHLSTYRDRLEIAFLPFPSVAQGLDLKEDTLFWARRYRLSISGRASALVCEVFSPQLSSFSS